MKRKQSVQNVVDFGNALLASKSICVFDENSIQSVVDDNDPRAYHFKEGICEMMEKILREDKS